MAIKTSELTKLISEVVTRDVAKKLIPKLRRVVREEVDRGMKDLIYEMVVKQGIALRGNDRVEAVTGIADDNDIQAEEERPQNVSSAKTFIAKRQASRAKAKQILENTFNEDDPFANLILNAEDPQEDLDLQQEQILDQPMKKSKDVSKGDSTLPENIDFSEHMEKLLPG